MVELHELDALAQAAAVRRGEVSPVELVEHHLRRIEDRDPELGAFVTLTPERALEQARAAERRLCEAGDEVPPLLGVPTAIKDLDLTAGVRTTFGSVLYANYVPDVDADVVRLLARAGTISLGKTATPEFGMSCYTEPAGRPPAVTPWDIGRLAGGSSGGAAAAVAAYLLPFAQGSDGGGSIRIPASACGLVGVKPSRGRVSRGPLGGDLTLLSVIGPLARTVADAAAMLDAMAVPQPGEPFWAPPLPRGESFTQHAGREPGRLRIARYATPPIPGVEVDPECLRAWEEASTLLAELGHEVADVALPIGPEVVTAFETVWAVSAHSVPVCSGREGELRPLTRWLRERGSRVGGPKLLRAVQTLQVAGRVMVAGQGEHDVVLTPTLAQLPRPVGWFSRAADPAEDFDRQKHFSPFTSVYNVTGQPAVSMPLHWTDDGLPVGVQLVGPPAGEGTLLALAGQLEAARPWAHRKPA